MDKVTLSNLNLSGIAVDQFEKCDYPGFFNPAGQDDQYLLSRDFWVIFAIRQLSSVLPRIAEVKRCSVTQLSILSFLQA